MVCFNVPVGLGEWPLTHGRGDACPVESCASAGRATAADTISSTDAARRHKPLGLSGKTNIRDTLTMNLSPTKILGE